MNEKQAQFDWGFGGLWLASVAAGAAVTWWAAYQIMWRLGEAAGQAGSELFGMDSEPVAVWMAGVIFGGLAALGGAFGPGLLLRRMGISAGRWIGFSVAVTAAVMSVGVLLISSLRFPMQDPAVSAAYLGLAFGLPMGLVQWRLLEKQGTPAAVWPLVNVTAYLLAAGIVVFFGGEGREWLKLGAVALTLGAITALGIVWLTRRETAMAL